MKSRFFDTFLHFKGSVTWHTIILKYVANRCIDEPTLCGFKSLVAKFYTICMYGPFRKNVLLFGLEVLVAHVFVRLKVLIAHVFVSLEVLIAHVLVWPDWAWQEHVLIKPRAWQKHVLLEPRAWKTTHFLPKKCHKRKLCRILRPNFWNRIV